LHSGVVSSPRTETPTKSLASQEDKVVVVVVGGLLVMAALVTMILWTIPGSMRWYLLGLAHAGLAAAGLHLLNSAFMAHDPQAMSYVRGAWGDDNTRTELEQARRTRLVWGWVDSIELQVGDIDHLVVTRHGGVVAIDSKWRNQTTDEDVAAVADSAPRAGLPAEGLLRTLLKAERRRRHHARTQPLSVSRSLCSGVLRARRCPPTRRSAASASSTDGSC
jgi:hypothetical protein